MPRVSSLNRRGSSLSRSVSIMLIRLYWFIRLIFDVISLGKVNRTPLLSLALLALLLLGVLFAAAQASAPFIYTLF